MLAAEALDLAVTAGWVDGTVTLGLRPLGGGQPAGDAGGRRAARPLERPARGLRPLPVHRPGMMPFAGHSGSERVGWASDPGSGDRRSD